MKIKLCLPEHEVSFIRHARLETLKHLDERITPEFIEPAPFAYYLLAYGNDESAPVGMAEFTFYSQVYALFEDTPYPPSFNLPSLAPFESFVGTRTLYVEPEARSQMPPYYLMLSMAGCQLAYQLGARYTTASTNFENTELVELYHKTGGKLLGKIHCAEHASESLAVFAFELNKLINHPAIRRLSGKVDIDPAILATVRSRSLFS